MAELFVWIATHLGALALMVLAATGLGQLLLRRHKFDSSVEQLVFTIALGLGTAASVIFGLGLAGLLYRKVLVALTIATALPGAVYLIRQHKTGPLFFLSRLKDCHSLPDLLRVFLIVALIGYWLLILSSTLYPPTLWDAISHHLVLSREYLTQHHLVAVAGNTHPAVAALNHMLFVWGMALQDDVLAQMIEHTFLMLTAIGLYAWGERTKKPRLGLALAAFWLGHPLVLLLGEAAYVDVCLVSLVFLGVYALRIFWDSQKASWWYLSTTLLGMAAGVKMGGVFFLFVGFALGVWVLVRKSLWNPQASRLETQLPPRLNWKVIIYGAALGFAIALPWYVFVAYHTGTPIYPITSPAIAANFGELISNQADPRTFANFLMLPINWIRYPSRFYGENNLTLSGLIVLWPLAWLVAVWNRSVRWWAFWAFSFTLCWFFLPHQLRYWLPALPLAGLALYESIEWCLERLSPSTFLPASVWTLLALLSLSWGGPGLYREVSGKGRPPTNPTERAVFLSRMDGYRAAEFVNANARENETVGVLKASWLIYYLNAKVEDLMAAPFARPPSFRWPEDQPWAQYLESRNLTWVLVSFSNGYPGKEPGRELDPKVWPDYELVYSDSSTWVLRRKLINSN